MKLSIVIYLKNIIKNEIDNKIFSEDFLKELLQDLLELLMTQYFTDQFLINATPLISLLINYFVNNSKNFLILDKFIYFLLEITSKYLNKIDNDFKLKPLITIYSTIFQSRLINADIDPYDIFNILFSYISIILEIIIILINLLINDATRVVNVRLLLVTDDL